MTTVARSSWFTPQASRGDREALGRAEGHQERVGEADAELRSPTSMSGAALQRTEESHAFYYRGDGLLATDMERKARHGGAQDPSLRIPSKKNIFEQATRPLQ